MYGLVLEGGGGKGAYHIGAVKALKEMGVGFSVVAGASVGALNGAMIVQDDIDRAYELWHDMDPSRVIKFDTEQTVPAAAGDLGAALNGTIARLKKIVMEKGLDVEPLIDLLRNVIDEERIRKSPVDFGIVTVDVTGRKAVEIFKEDIPAGRLVDYIVASANFPAFKPVIIDGKRYIDGGFYNNLPINLVQQKGCTDVIVIRTFGIGFRRNTDLSGLNITNIAPVDNLGPVLDFSAGTARKTLKLGYFDAIKAYRGLKGRRYYIEPLGDDEFFIKYLTTLADEKVQRLCNLFGVERYSGKRAVFELLVPRVADLLGMPASASYEEIAVGLLEHVAHTCGVERFEIYTLRQLYSIIAESKKFFYDGFLNEMPGFLKSSDLLVKLAKPRVIDGVAGELFDNFR